MSRLDPEADKIYQREYMRQRRAKQKQEKMGSTKQEDFTVPTANIGRPEKTLDLNSKEIQALLKLAEKANKKDSDMGDDDKILKYMAKAAEYAPMAQSIIKNLFEGFNAAALNSQNARVQSQPQQNTLRAPDGWEHMSGLQRLGRKYSQPDWYAAGEAYETLKSTGGQMYVTPVNTGYIDPTYRQPPQEPRNLQELKHKYPEPPVVSDSMPVTEEPKRPAFAKQKEETPVEEKPPVENVELINAMREDNNKYTMLAFNFLEAMNMDEFKGYVQNIDTLKPKFEMLNLLLPIQTREMLKKTTSEELVEVFKEKCPVKYKWLKEEKKIPELMSLFDELKGGLQ
jgi:hypothetical protein